jgi:hypothetical protein
MTDNTEILRFGVTASASPAEERIIAISASAAQLAYEEGDGVIPETAAEVEEGAAFTIELVIPTELESGDGRKLLKDSLSTRELPIPLLWQPKTGTGHDGSYVVGRIDSCEVTPEGIKNAHGVFDTGPYGREAERLVRNGMLRGISADLDMFQAATDEEMAALAAETGEDLSQKMFIKQARVMAATLLPKPAFQECTIRLSEDLEENPVVDGVYEADADFADNEEAVVAALIASAIPVTPPKAWFDNPKLKKPTPLTVDDNGQVYGHIATWVQDHIGAHGIRPPRSKSNYAYFHTGLVRTDSGEDVTVGQLTLAGGHASLDKSKEEAMQHYDSTGSAIADVHAGEDAHGIWVAGALRPGATPEQIRTLRASAPSGDWRPVNNRLELVAICQVNVPGFPIARTCVASGNISALVAAGAGTLYKMKHNAVEERIASVESILLTQQKESVAAEMAAAREKRKAELAAAVEEIRAQFAPDLEERQKQLAALEAERDAVRAEFAWNVKYDEAKHPRDRHGKWRKKLARLTDILGPNDDSGAVEEIRHAVEAEEVGDYDEAKAAGRAAKVSINEALERVEDPAKVKALKKAVAEVNEAIESADDDPTPAKRGGGDDPITAALRSLIEKILDELYEEVDPERLTDMAWQRLKQYVDGSDFANPQEIAELLARLLMKQFTPNAAQ